MTSWLYISPLMLVLIPFFVLPILVVLVASVFETDGFGGLIPTFTLANYGTVLTSGLTYNLYFETAKFTVFTWFFTLLLGFFVAYFLVFHVRNPLLAIGLFLICTVPFWTSNIIRMISWIPLLGKEGLINSALLHLGLIREPLEFLLYSGFAVVVAYVHQLTIFMIVPIFNSMGRIDKRVVEAALDAGDYDRCGRPTLWVTNYENELHALYHNDRIVHHQADSQYQAKERKRVDGKTEQREEHEGTYEGDRHG